MEAWDLYTKDREKTEMMMLRGAQRPEGLYHIVIHVCIFNEKGEMLIQQRQPFKEGWPNMWDVTVGGSAVTGETSQWAAEREVEEELGLELELDDVRPSLTVNFDHGFDDFYLIKKEVELEKLQLQQEEVQAVKWAGISEILEMIASGEFIPYRENLIRLLFEMSDGQLGAHRR